MNIYSNKKIFILNSVLILLLIFTLFYLYLSYFVKAQETDTTPPEISNVVIENLTPTSVTFRWQTNEPADSEVDYGIYAYEESEAKPTRNPNLVTSHTITINGLWPNTNYYYRIKSRDASGNLGVYKRCTTDSTGKTTCTPHHTFKTPSLNPNDPFDFYFLMRKADNPTHVFQGYPIYLIYRIIPISGSYPISQNLVKVELDESSLPPNSSYGFGYLASSPINKFQTFSSVGEKIAGVLAIYTSKSTPLGEYNIRLKATIKSTQKELSYQIKVIPVPPLPSKPSQPVNPPPIPDLDKWGQRMISDRTGKKWCEIQLGNNPSIKPYECCGWEGSIWYYDGMRVFYQVADYTRNPYWLECAATFKTSTYRSYREVILQNNGLGWGWRIFPHGLYEDYVRTNDIWSKEAVLSLAYNTPWTLHAGGIESGMSRETAYLIQSYLFNEKLGELPNPRLERALNYALGHLDQWVLSRTAPFAQAFFVGLTMQALIEYYEEKEQDPRIPYLIKKTIDWLWEEMTDYNTYLFYYIDKEVPEGSGIPAYIDGRPIPASDLNMMTAPAFAWYYYLTGDPVYQQRADLLFKAAVKYDDVDFRGKFYSQHYRWSFDHVRWRSSPIDPSDKKPPIISNIRVTKISPVFVKITWNTDEPATSQVEYGFTSNYDKKTITYSKLTTSHFVFINYLRPQSLYNFRVISKDKNGNISFSNNYTFETGSIEEMTPQQPQRFVDTSYNLPTGGRTFYVKANDDLQQVINSANLGDVIILQAGAVFKGNFKLPKKEGNGWLYIQSSEYNSLPSSGTRISPDYSNYLPKIISPNQLPAIEALPGAHHYRFVGIEITTEAENNDDLIVLGNSITDINQIPHHIIFDRSYIHGRNDANSKRGISLNSYHSAIIDSYLSDFHHNASSSQAIVIWNNPGPIKINNNFIESAGENIFLGYQDSSHPQFNPSDIEIRYNLISKSLFWKTTTSPWKIRSLLVIKNASRVMIEGNIFENLWTNISNWESIIVTEIEEAGFAIVISPKSYNLKTRWSIVEDITFKNNIVRHIPSVFYFFSPADTKPMTLGVNRVLIKNNLFDDIDGYKWGGRSGIFAVLNNYRIQNIVFNHNTIFQKEKILRIYNQVSGFVFQNNLASYNSNPISINDLRYLPGYLIEKNVLPGGNINNDYPTNNFYPSTLDSSNFVDKNNGNYRLSTSSPYKNKATDNKDIGADIDELESVIFSGQSSSSTNLIKIKLNFPYYRNQLQSNFIFSIFNPQNNQKIFEITGQTNKYGDYQSSWPENLQSGIYNLVVKINYYLRKKITNFSLSPGNLIRFDNLIYGDFNNDGIINTVDWTLLKQYWNKNNEIYDIYRDGIINTFDWLLLKKNWNKQDE